MLLSNYHMTLKLYSIHVFGINKTKGFAICGTLKAPFHKVSQKSIRDCTVSTLN